MKIADFCAKETYTSSVAHSICFKIVMIEIMRIFKMSFKQSNPWSMHRIQNYAHFTSTLTLCWNSQTQLSGNNTAWKYLDNPWSLLFNITLSGLAHLLQIHQIYCHMCLPRSSAKTSLSGQRQNTYIVAKYFQLVQLKQIKIYNKELVFAMKGSCKWQNISCWPIDLSPENQQNCTASQKWWSNC